MADLDQLEDLARWWWGLTNDEREIKRAEFIQKMQDDPEFASAVVRLLREEKPYFWSTV